MFGHVRLNHAKMLSCGSQRAEASSPIAQRPSGVTAWRLNRRYMISTPGTAQQAGFGADRKVQKFLVRHYNKNVPQCPSGLGSYINSRASVYCGCLFIIAEWSSLAAHQPP